MDREQGVQERGERKAAIGCDEDRGQRSEWGEISIHHVALSVGRDAGDHQRTARPAMTRRRGSGSSLGRILRGGLPVARGASRSAFLVRYAMAARYD